MDEVDIDNVEDLNELEARLYAQIHHEATDEPIVQNGLVGEEVHENASNGIDINQNVETTRQTNKVLSRRYWASGDQSMKQQQQEPGQQQRFIRNPFKPTLKSQQQRKQNESPSMLGKTSENIKEPENINSPADNLKNSVSSKTAPNDRAHLSPSDSVNNSKFEAATSEQNDVPEAKSNIKLNPIAEWMQRKNKQTNKKANNNNRNKNPKNSSINTKPGPFSRQQEKLQKAKRIEEKRERSRKAKNASDRIAQEMKVSEVIDLDSDKDSDSSDVLVIPTVPPPTFIVEDSGDECDNAATPILLEHEENALDSTDVQMSSTTASFIKPQKISMQVSAAGTDGAERRLENISRCTSPCSIQSSDDFIGQTDRSRLLAETSGVADDEDLLLLTSDINSLLEVPDNAKPLDGGTYMEIEKNHVESSLKQAQIDDNTEILDSSEFATPRTSHTDARSENYRVDQGVYTAFDVYESESDKTDSVYAKGATKSTIIRQIDTSSDEQEDIGNCSLRTKRLRKRRASSSNKESDQNNENIISTSDTEDPSDDDNKLLRTGVPFISRGIAVERYKPRKRIQPLSSSTLLNNKRKSTNDEPATNDMLPLSDSIFIEKLNNLAQGQEAENKSQALEDVEESDSDNIPSARDIAEKILAEHSINKKSNKKPGDDDDALPNEILTQLDEVFASIDQFDKQVPNWRQDDNEAVEISDSSDDDREKHLVYKSSPGDKGQIIEYSPKASNPLIPQPNTFDENGSPIYNIIFIRGPRNLGGIGWNDEMRKFYNNSWNGEHFILRKILQKMNPDKSLWRIYTEDRLNIKTNKRHNLKCTNCCEFGHMRFKCKRPRKPLICYMCGESGHLEPRCPNTICLRCGTKTEVYTRICNICSFQNRLTCPLCKIRGHSLDYCPDKWRRYHSTTEGNSYPESNVLYNCRKFCCICGAEGHISDNCRSAVRFSEYPAVSSKIKSYEKAYRDVVLKNPYNGLALNLMYKPCEDYKFYFGNQTSSDKYYGRFLEAVGMDCTLRRDDYHMDFLPKELMSKEVTRKEKRLSKRYEANPYLKAAANQKNSVSTPIAPPNQVQEITESSNSNQKNKEQSERNNVTNVEEKSDNEMKVVVAYSLEQDVQSNKTNQRTTNTQNDQQDKENFKSPMELATKSQTESALVLDSDSNYSFSEHFDVVEASNLENVPVVVKTPPLTATLISKRKSREMDILPDYIPLTDSSENQNEQNGDYINSTIGISRRFVAAVSDHEDEMEENIRNSSPLPEIPCEGKIYLAQIHCKYLLSPIGNAFLKKISRAHKIRARLDFTSVGHVLVIFGLPLNQDKFQRELLLKYRELEYEKDEKHLKNRDLNVPKRTCVLIKFLRESIIQLLKYLGNVNQLLSRLKYHERQGTKTGYKLAEKVRRSLNMILVGQAGLVDGTMHLDKLLISLKKLINDVSDDVAPPELRLQIAEHYKLIFSAYRHENYQKLVETYNRLISKNRLPQLNIDPVLLGQKVLNTTLSEEQKQKLEQAKTPGAIKEPSINEEPSGTNQKNGKQLKRKLNFDAVNTSSNAANTTTNKTKTATPYPTENPKKQRQTGMCPPPALDAKNISTANTTNQNINKSTANQNVTDKWTSTHDTLLTQICSGMSTSSKEKVVSSKLPSPFWSRESQRYLDECIPLAAAKPQIVEKLLRIQNKSKNGRLSYNDYLAVIKVHTALCNGK